MNDAVMDICGHRVLISLGYLTHLGLKFLGHMVTFLGPASLFSKVATPFYIPRSSL